MSQEDELIEEYELLKSAPDSARWLTELERIMLGQREYAIKRLGSVEQYIKLTLDESPDYAKARASFKAAFDLTVHFWQATESEWNENTIHIIDLIAAYSPPYGASKLLDYLRCLNRFDFPSLPDEKKDELRLKTLVAMERYYFLEPYSYETDPVCIAYRKILESAATNDTCDFIREYANQRLQEITKVEAKVIAHESNERAENLIESLPQYFVKTP